MFKSIPRLVTDLLPCHPIYVASFPVDHTPKKATKINLNILRLTTRNYNVLMSLQV